MSCFILQLAMAVNAREAPFGRARNSVVYCFALKHKLM